MNYELEKKLKDAGFPQHQPLVNDGNGNWNYHPTLSELIEACGDRFHCLVYTTNGGMDCDRKFWSAGNSPKVHDWQNGSSPEEAVTRLWLAINKK